VNLGINWFAVRLLLMELAKVQYDVLRAPSLLVIVLDLFPGLPIEGSLNVLVL
jgi:hypothetical protein